MHTLEQLRSGALAGIRRLDLACGLTQVPAEVFDLADSLEVLNLTGNHLDALPPDMGRLKRLRVLFASNNRFTVVPESLGDCPSLETVGFRANRIGLVPAASLPASLRSLVLTDNLLERLPERLGLMPNLQKLMLTGNRLCGLPETLAAASALELLRLAANQLGRWPTELGQLPRLAWLALAGNPCSEAGSASDALPKVDWSELAVRDRLGEGASGEVFEVRAGCRPHLALKLFKGTMGSDGLPDDELWVGAGVAAHPAVMTPVAQLQGHPEHRKGVLMPLLPAAWQDLAAPPSLERCTRDVYPVPWRIGAAQAWRLAGDVASAVAHLHAHGVMHGDLYAHNIRWDSATGQAILCDLGAATRLPMHCPDLAGKMMALEVRAFGCLVEELASGVLDSATSASLQQLADACLQTDPAERPTMAMCRERLRRA